MIESISGLDKLIILKNTGGKFLRGLWKRLFLRKASGMFLVGRHVRITHGRHITCGKNVKFEDLPEDWKCPICGVGKSLFKEIEN